MPQVRSSTQIDAPPERVWALMCDPRRYPEWVIPTDRMLEAPEEDLGVGYVYREHGGIPPFKGDSEWRVTVFEPHRRQVHVGDDGMVTIDLEIELAPVDGGTRLTQTVDLTPRWFMAPLNAILWPLMMRSRAQQAMDDTLANAKRVVESTQP